MLMETQIADPPCLPEPCDHFRRLVRRLREDGGENPALAGRIAACRLDLNQLQLFGRALVPGRNSIRLAISDRLLAATPINA